MKIKPNLKSFDISADKSLAKLSKELKYLFSSNGRKTLRGSYRKPARDVETVFREKVIVQSSIFSHEIYKPSKVAKNINYISRDVIEVYKRDFEQSLINNHSIAHWEADKFHYMLIVSPQNGENLRLDEFAKEIVKEMQKDLGTTFDWVAAIHRNTDNPHIHLMMRGKDETNNDLEIRTQYLHRVVPQIASEIATVRLQQDKQYIKRHRSLANERKHENKHSRNQVIRRGL